MFNPLDHLGIPLENQIRNWRELAVDPIDPATADPYTRCRIVTANAIEVAAILFGHHLARMCGDDTARRRLAYVRYLESQQQCVVNWLLPPVNPLESTLVHEQGVVELTAWIARNEPDPYLRQAYEFGVLEDLDHLHRYGLLAELEAGLLPGRPGAMQHRHPFDNVRAAYCAEDVEPRSKLHALAVLAAEQQVMSHCMNIGPLLVEPKARRFYQEVCLVEQEHVTHYESLLDPGESGWERLLLLEYTECYLYHSFLQQEPDKRVRSIWELHLQMELAHLQHAVDLFRQFTGREPEEVVGTGLPEPVGFESNAAFLEQLRQAQEELTTLGAGYVRMPHERCESMRVRLSGGTPPPSERL